MAPEVLRNEPSNEKHSKVSVLPNQQVAHEALSTYKLEPLAPTKNSLMVKTVLENCKSLHTALLILNLLVTCDHQRWFTNSSNIFFFLLFLVLSYQCLRITTNIGVYATKIESIMSKVCRSPSSDYSSRRHALS